MAGKLRVSIVSEIEECFVNNCLTLFGEAYLYIKENKEITVDWDEENISAFFFEFIDKSETAIALNINISDEHRLFYADILDGKKKAKTASRIDFRLTTNWSEQKKRLEYFVEAKNLIENDCSKGGRKTKINAQKNQERYIKTGIDNFVSGKYPPRSCLVGYVLQGNPNEIVKKINNHLLMNGRATEQLQIFESYIQNLQFCYHSNHTNDYLLKHFFLQFSTSK